MATIQSHPRVNELKALFRNLQQLRSLYMAEGIDEISTPSGERWSLWDLEYLYSSASKVTSPRQAEAVTLCLVENRTEAEAAVQMGISETNPVAIYATQAIARLCEAIDAGVLPRFQPDQAVLAARRKAEEVAAWQRIAENIVAKTVVEVTGCWPYLDCEQRRPIVALRDSRFPEGIRLLHPLEACYRATAEVPPEHGVWHKDMPWYFRACANPEHAIVVPTRKVPA
jgi:hypothetical protein